MNLHCVDWSHVLLVVSGSAQTVAAQFLPLLSHTPETTTHTRTYNTLRTTCTRIHVHVSMHVHCICILSTQPTHTYIHVHVHAVHRTYIYIHVCTCMYVHVHVQYICHMSPQRS